MSALGTRAKEVITNIFNIIDLDLNENSDLYEKICKFYIGLPEEQTQNETSFFDHISRLGSYGGGEQAGFAFNSANKAKIRKIFKEAFAGNSGDQLKAELIVSGENCSSPVIRFLQSYDLRERDKPGVALAEFLKKQFAEKKYSRLIEDDEQIEIINTLVNMVFSYERTRLHDRDSMIATSSTATLYSTIGEYPFYKQYKVAKTEFVEALKEIGLLNENETWNMDKIVVKNNTLF